VVEKVTSTIVATVAPLLPASMQPEAPTTKDESTT
jgi:hypothetical protein